MSSPTLRWNLSLHPHHIEKQFWQSAVWRRWTVAIDQCSILITSVNSSVILLIHYLSVPGYWPTFQYMILLAIMLTLAQGLWMRLRPSSYFVWRRTVVYFSRTMRLLATLKSITLLRKGIRAGQIGQLGTPDSVPSYLSPSTNSYLPDFINPLRPLLAGSLAYVPFMHGCGYPLPFLPQCVLQLTYFGFMLRLATPIALLSMRLSYFTSSVYSDYCHTLNSIMGLAQSVLTGELGNVEMPAASQACDEKGEVVLVFFLYIFLSLLLPLYLSYRLEYCAKNQFLEQYTDSWQTQPPDVLEGARVCGVELQEEASWPGTCRVTFVDLVVVLAMAVGAFVGVREGHEVLERLVGPLS